MAPNANLQRLHDAGVSIWLDTLSRQLLDSGEFAALIRDYSVTGATSNPTIFAKAITDSNLYDDQLRSVASQGAPDPQELFFALDDVRDAARELRPAYDVSSGARRVRLVRMPRINCSDCSSAGCEHSRALRADEGGRLGPQ